MRRLLLTGLGLVVILCTFVFLLPQFAGYGSAWHAMRTLSWAWIAALAACAVFDLVTFAPPWQVALPGLRFWPAFAVTQASTATSLVAPAGSAVGIAIAYRELRARGFGGRETSRAVSLTSFSNQVVNLAYPVVAVGLLAASGHATAILVPAAILGACLFAVAVLGGAAVFASNRLAGLAGDRIARVANWVLRLGHRGPVTWGGPSFERFRLETADLLRRRWLLLSLTTTLNGVATLVTLTVSLRAVGVTDAEVSFTEIFAAWALSRFVTSIELTPGGFGVFELSLTTALVSFGGPAARVVAAVLLYRALTALPTLAIGLLVLAASRRPRWRSGIEVQ